MSHRRDQVGGGETVGNDIFLYILARHSRRLATVPLNSSRLFLIKFGCSTSLSCMSRLCISLHLGWEIDCIPRLLQKLGTTCVCRSRRIYWVGKSGNTLCWSFDSVPQRRTLHKGLRSVPCRVSLAAQSLYHT